MKIYCTGCETEINARFTTGAEIYPHRPDLHSLPFWRCGGCNNYVGCHHKTKNRTRPLGCIPTPEILAERKQIHRLLDPLWRNGLIERRAAYAYISRLIGREYHTGEIRSVDEACAVREAVAKLRERCGVLPKESGGPTGLRCDVVIIDDPYKDYADGL